MYEIRLHGLGGQGAVTLVNWVAMAAYNQGKHVQAFPFFGAERRGAPVKAYMRMDEEPIDLRSQIYRPDLLVVLSPDLTGAAVAEGITDEGQILLNCEELLAGKLAARFGREMYYVDATGIAIEHGLEVDGMPMVNIPLLGAMVAKADIAPFDGVMKVIDRVARRGDYDAYHDAALEGFEGLALAGARETVA